MKNRLFWTHCGYLGEHDLRGGVRPMFLHNMVLLCVYTGVEMLDCGMGFFPSVSCTSY